MDSHSLLTLEFDQLKAVIAGFTSWEGGKKELEKLLPFISLVKLNQRQKEVKEAVKLSDCGEELNFSGLFEVNAQLLRAKKGGALKGDELLKILKLLEFSSLTRRFFELRKDLAPELADTAKELFTFPPLIKELKDTFTPEGEVKDTASQTLKFYREEIKKLESEVKKKLASLFKSTVYRKMLQEPLITTREDRFVVPVRSECRNQFPGLLIDRSLSGATIFVQPWLILDASNALREARIEERRETELILLKLSEKIGKIAGELLHNSNLLSFFDLQNALAGFAGRYSATLPRINTSGYLSLSSARHPLLKVKVVPIELELGSEFSALLLTGPNTGGKTVSLKTVGLLSIMALCGMPIPAEENSTIPFFKNIYADIGDEQSISQNLSTFSAHLLKIQQFLKEADQDCLVLIDELGAGTDPLEGAALGIAILKAFTIKQVRILASTHLGELKNFAAQYPGIQNAAMEFDPQTLEPLFKVKMGKPGKSLAFEVAKRLGLPEAILQDARGFLPAAHQAMEELLSRLKIEEEELLKAQKEAEQLKADYQEKNRELENAKAEILEELSAQGEEFLRAAKAKAEGIISALTLKKTRKHNRKEIKELRQTVKGEFAERIEKLLPKKSAAPSPAPLSFAPGDLVLIVSLEKSGEILSLDKDGKWEVKSGNLRMHFTQDELKLITGEQKAEQRIFDRFAFEKQKTLVPKMELIGLTVPEAILKLEKYLDDALLAGLSHFSIVHGKGSGTLRKAVQEFLKSRPEVEDFKLADYNKGGWGVTEVNLK